MGNTTVVPYQDAAHLPQQALTAVRDRMEHGLINAMYWRCTALSAICSLCNCTMSHEVAFCVETELGMLCLGGCLVHMDYHSCQHHSDNIQIYNVLTTTISYCNTHCMGVGTVRHTTSVVKFRIGGHWKYVVFGIDVAFGMERQTACHIELLASAGSCLRVV